MLQGISEGKGYVDLSTIDVETAGDVNEVIITLHQEYPNLIDCSCGSNVPIT